MTVSAYSVYRNELHKMEVFPSMDYDSRFVLYCDTDIGDVRVRLNQEQFNSLCELIDEYRALNLICTQNKTAKEE